MRRRIIEIGIAVTAIVALALVLYNATLVDRRAPAVVSIALSATAGGDASLGQTLASIDIEFSEPVRTATVERRFRIEPYVPGSFSWDGDTTAIFTPAEKLPPDTAFTVTIDAGFEDLAGNAANAPAGPFAFRTVGPPVLVSSDPADASDGIPVDAPIRLTFDRLMDTGSVEQAVRLDPPVDVTAAWSGPTLTLTPTSPLRFGTTYALIVGDGATDTDGTHVATAVTVRFTTVAAGLTVVAAVPAADASGVDVRTPIALVFDAPVDPASADAALTVVPSVGGDIRVVDLADDTEAAVGASPPPGPRPGRVVLFTPAGPLAPHTTYTIRLRSVVHRLDSPDQVAPERTWSFTTGQPSQTVQNQIAFLSARAGVRNVWVMNPDGSNPRQLTSELVPVSGFDVTADGTRVVYAAGGVVIDAAVDGSERRVLTAADRLEYAPLLAPDGRSLLVARRDATGADAGYWIVPYGGASDVEERQLLAAGAPPLGSVRLAGDGLADGTGVPPWGRRAAFSADGTSLVIVTGSGEVHGVDLRPAGMAAPLPLTADGPPAWSPVAEAFLLAASEAGSGTTVRRIAPPRDGAGWMVEALWPAAGAVTVAQDGGIAALVPAAGAGAGGGSAVGSRAHLAYTARAALAPTPLTTSAELADRAPAFAPDGRTILFARVPADQPLRSAGIWTVGPDGRELRQLSIDGAYPRWLP